jgi:ABC-2 type transport system permease protein
MIDGFRYGFFAQSDVDPWQSLAVVAASLLLAAGIAIRMLATGYKLRG